MSADVPPRAGDAPAIIQGNYVAAHRRYESNPNDDEAAWQLGRACYDRAEFPRDHAERAELANEGIAVCTKLIARRPNFAAGHYYLAMNLAQLARTKMLGALPIVRRMEKEWLAALALDEKFDYAGPHRYLGLLYRDAPGEPLSVGDKGKARRHLLRAVELSPNFPENYLNLIESDLMWKRTGVAAAALEKLRRLLPSAHEEFTGKYWEPSWKDWNGRLEKIQEALNEPRPAPGSHRR